MNLTLGEAIPRGFPFDFYIFLNDHIKSKPHISKIVDFGKAWSKRMSNGDRKTKETKIEKNTESNGSQQSRVWRVQQEIRRIPKMQNVLPVAIIDGNTNTPSKPKHVI
jgi:hypothetical protein